jgi:hypothetical protein
MLLKDDDDFNDLDLSPDPEDSDNESRAEAERMFMQDQTDIVGEDDPDDAEDDAVLPDDQPIEDEENE